jgi:hypothetical protein
MKEDPKLSFCKLKANDQYYTFPVAELLTRRLKKMAQLISRVDGQYDFETPARTGEHSGFTAEEKSAIISILGDYGIPSCTDDVNKPDWPLIKARA